MPVYVLKNKEINNLSVPELIELRQEYLNDISLIKMKLKYYNRVVLLLTSFIDNNIPN